MRQKKAKALRRYAASISQGPDVVYERQAHAYDTVRLTKQCTRWLYKQLKRVY